MIQELFLIDERPATSTKRTIGVNAPGNAEDIFMHGDGQSAYGLPVWKRTRTTHYGADASDVYIPLRPYKMKKIPSKSWKSGAFMQKRGGGTKGKK